MPDHSILVTGGRVIDPANTVDDVLDLLIEHDRIVEVGRSIQADAAERVDASGKLVTPGWIDVHVHLRDPGYPAKETLETGIAAAAAGGFTTIACMPNTRPALDNATIIADLVSRAGALTSVKVRPISAITIGQAGQELVDLDAIIAAGAIGFSDDGVTTVDSLIMRRALEASVRVDRPVIVHCEDRHLATGAMNEGVVSQRLALPGIPSAAEEIIIARDLMLAELTGGWLHVCHVSTGRGSELIAEAKRRGVRVTAEVMPHHLVMADTWVEGARILYNTDEPDGVPGRPADPNTKVNPPLRTVEDTRALLSALKDGVFDCLGTDHAPHAEAEKAGSTYESAAFGMSGLELAFPATYALVRAGHLDLTELVRRWTVEPARILREESGTLGVGAVADVTVFDPDRKWTVSAESLRTRSANTPMLGMTLRGRAVATIVNGEIRYRE